MPGIEDVNIKVIHLIRDPRGTMSSRLAFGTFYLDVSILVVYKECVQIYVCYYFVSSERSLIVIILDEILQCIDRVRSCVFRHFCILFKYDSLCQIPKLILLTIINILRT